MDFNRNSIIVRDSDIDIRAYPQGTVLLAFRTSQAWQLNPVSKRFFELIDAPQQLSAVIDRISEESCESLETVAPVLAQFAEECLHARLIRLVPSSDDAMGP